MSRIVFLGTGGGRSVMFSQARKTGGILFELGPVRFILDPGPGSLYHMNSLKLNPRGLKGVLLSHLHPDHSTDVNAYLDGISDPFLITHPSCVKPTASFFPCVSLYHVKKSSLYAMKGGDAIKISNLHISSSKMKHTCPGLGFRIKAENKVIGYPSDGVYYKGLEKQYGCCDILILNILVPSGMTPKEKKHMGTADAIEFVKKIKNKPRLIIIQHFSFWMLKAGVWPQARLIEKETGIKCIAAEDFMELDLETLKAKKLKV